MFNFVVKEFHQPQRSDFPFKKMCDELWQWVAKEHIRPLSLAFLDLATPVGEEAISGTIPLKALERREA